MPAASPATPAAALPVVRSLFALATDGKTGVFQIQRAAFLAGGTCRLELEGGYVHAMSNVGDPSPRGEDTLVPLLARIGDEAVPAFAERAPRSPLMGRAVAAFHPARALRRHVELHAARVAPSDEARLVLKLRPHPSCVDGLETLVLARLDRDHGQPTRSAAGTMMAELVALAPRPLVVRLVQFLDAVGALAIDDPLHAEAFAALGLPPGAAPDAVKSAWRRLARELHPDLASGLALSDEEARSRAARFQAASEAYQRLLPDA